MSTSSFTGTIKNFSPKPNEDYYGIFIDNGKEEKWLNGHGDPKDSWSKGDKVKIKANMDEFIEIQEIDVISEDEQAGSGSASKGAPNGSEGGQTSSDQNFTSKDDRINKKVAFKEACETVRQLESDNNSGEHQERVSAVANGYYNILKSMGGE